MYTALVRKQVYKPFGLYLKMTVSIYKPKGLKIYTYYFLFMSYFLAGDGKNGKQT